MIAKNQPTIFDNSVKVLFSAASDGSVAKGGGEQSTPEHYATRKRLLDAHGFATENNTTVFMTYGDDRTYHDIYRVIPQNTGQSITSDALYTTETNVPIFLPVADCIATVVYDPVKRMLGVLHLGRHASAAHLIEHFADEVKKSVGSEPKDWLVWMSPSLQLQNNYLEYFDPPSLDEWEPYTLQKENKVCIDIPAHNRERFEALGVKPENIEVSEVDTYTDTNYFSHRAAIEGSQPERQGRMAIIAQMNELK